MTLPLGSFASNVSAPHEVAAALIGVLSDVDFKLSASYLLRFRDLPPSHRADHERLVRGLLRQLNRHVCEFCYVGHHQADLSNWGVWIDLGKLHEAEKQGRLIQASNLAVKTRATYILEIGDRVRLWKTKGRKQLWEAP